ncbi:senescence-specific cysteine protease SAG12-like [Vicia villosa]|uniref:senescence-specific cysteine protease SAG12-like n=1 Tax=Vicia villosa TaxID=3911 RepID=UPI00273ACE01|nr:senescence-specific cysteine protease SAG12-like [Vicia villosa]
MTYLTIVSVMILWECTYAAMSKTLHESSIVEAHQQWMIKYGRTYPNNFEMEKRLQIFKENLEYIEKFNKVGNKSYTLGLNQFSDLTSEEFLASYTRNKVPSQLFSSKMISNTKLFNVTDEVPTNFDWRQQGMVTDVKKQGTCGCCCAFAAVAAVEGNIQPTTQISNWKSVTTNDEEQLLQAVAQQPIGALIAFGEEFHAYKEGIYTGPCGKFINHALLIVGYGESEGKKYWLIKNSWGTGWGENGYMRLLREGDGTSGHCDIATYVAYPAV